MIELGATVTLVKICAAEPDDCGEDGDGLGADEARTTAAEVALQPGTLLQVSSSMPMIVQTWQLDVMTCFGTEET